MARPKRSDQIDLLNQVKEVAWQQIAERGASALSLRAIAQTLHITAPAIYHYYPSRDDLVTALIVDAFTSMGDAQFAALEGLAPDDHRARLNALGTAYRQWANTYPQRYLLIFGTPIPGYHAPPEITNPSAARGLVPLIHCLESANLDGKLRLRAKMVMPASLIQQFENYRATAPVSHIDVLYAALVVWSRVHGLVSLEIDSQFPPFIEDLPSFYQLQIDNLIEEMLIL